MHSYNYSYRLHLSIRHTWKKRCSLLCFTNEELSLRTTFTHCCALITIIKPWHSYQIKLTLQTGGLGSLSLSPTPNRQTDAIRKETEAAHLSFFPLWVQIDHVAIILTAKQANRLLHITLIMLQLIQWLVMLKLNYFIMLNIRNCMKIAPMRYTDLRA